MLLTTKSWDFTKKHWGHYLKMGMLLVISLGFVGIATIGSMMAEWSFSKTIFKHKKENRIIMGRCAAPLELLKTLCYKQEQS